MFIGTSAIRINKVTLALFYSARTCHVESDVRRSIDSWALLLPLLSKPSIARPSENITVLFLNVFAQISPKMIGTKAAWSREIYKTREATLRIQGESDQERKGVLYLKLTVTCLQVTWPKSRHLCYLYTSSPAFESRSRFGVADFGLVWYEDTWSYLGYSTKINLSKGYSTKTNLSKGYSTKIDLSKGYSTKTNLSKGVTRRQLDPLRGVTRKQLTLSRSVTWWHLTLSRDVPQSSQPYLGV